MEDEIAERPVSDMTGSAQRLFENASREAGYDPDSKWMGGYVDYEWTHLRPLLKAYGLNPAGKRVLEFGCNVGASSIIMAAMGGTVTGIDVDAQMIKIASANALRHKMENLVEIIHVSDTRSQPFADDSFDLVIANSVLEYVATDELCSILGEIHRVMKPGGELFVCGTASRVAPREIHSGRWLVNYLPRWVDRISGKNLQRGLSPLRLARSIQDLFSNVYAGRWSRGRIAVHGKLSVPVRSFDLLCRIIRIAPGWLAPNIELVFTKIDQSA